MNNIKGFTIQECVIFDSTVIARRATNQLTFLFSIAMKGMKSEENVIKS
jgi:hypothetical protein